ncbi:MAG: hypothetical protein U0795_25755 [Pirellulales bacterium]
MSFCKLRRRTWSCLLVTLGTFGPGIHSASAQWSPLSAAATPATTPATGYGMTGMNAPAGSMVAPAQYTAGPQFNAAYGANNAPEAWEGGTTQAFPGNYAGIGLHGATGTFGEEQAAAMCNGGPGGTCSPRRVTFGYYGPIWRKWPVPGPADRDEAERPRVFGAPSQPTLPDAEHESEIYVPPRTTQETEDEAPASSDAGSTAPSTGGSPAPAAEKPAEKPAEPAAEGSRPSAPPALPSDLEGTTGPSLNEGASTGWGDVSQSLATTDHPAESNSTTALAKRPMTLRRISQTRTPSAGPTAVQEASYVTRSSDRPEASHNPVRRASAAVATLPSHTAPRTTGRQNPLR